MNDEDLRRLINETMETQYKADSFSDDMPTHATAHPPATPVEIVRLEEHLRTRGFSLPPSFVQFLRIHNGIENFIPSMELSIRTTQEIEKFYEKDLLWKKISPAHRFVFASGDTAAFAGFIPETVNQKGEMQVVLVTESAETTEYDDFEEFLEDQLEYYKDVISAEQADREDLLDD